VQSPVPYERLGIEGYRMDLGRLMQWCVARRRRGIHVAYAGASPCPPAGRVFERLDTVTDNGSSHCEFGDKPCHRILGSVPEGLSRAGGNDSSFAASRSSALDFGGHVGMD
jgi:hypothetical protein